ncbi:MAG: hypothetical protein A2X56_01590 [Nitrospirae bacterium GWC2_57_13]|nr:MAG: hypothetical protein A2X56_01590 [Nitrospirae bacterium GWC2_57_13]HAR45153.1 hypothetical protein [Nitrospiraceae bacterium]
MKRRDFLRYLATAGIGLAGAQFAADLFLPFAEAADIPTFSFAHITDLHLDVNGDRTWQYREKSVPLFIDALRQVGRLPRLRFLLFGGDQVHAGPNDRESLTVFHRWTSLLDIPHYMLLGNEEVCPIPGVSRLGKEDYLKVWRGRGIRPGSSSWSFEPASGVLFIGFDVTSDGKSYGLAPPARLRWLERELSANRSKKLIIIATHQLLFPSTPLDLTPAWSLWMVRNHAEVRELISRYPNVRLAISGHHHSASVIREGGIIYVSDPAVVTFPCAFRLFTVTPQGVSLRNIGIDDRSLMTQARELLHHDPYARVYNPSDPESILQYSMGLSEQDREAVLPFTDDDQGTPS